MQETSARMHLFRITIKTKLVLTRLLKYDPDYGQPLYAQHHAAQSVHKEDEQIDDDDLLQRQKLLAKEPEVPEKYVGWIRLTPVTCSLTNDSARHHVNWVHC